MARIFSTPVPAGWDVLRVPTDRNSPGRLNYSNQPSRSFQWHFCLRLRKATVVGPEVAAFPQVLGEMTPLIWLHQTCGQDSGVGMQSGVQVPRACL